jgi:hypothetical protein
MAAETIKFSELSGVTTVNQNSIFPIVQDGENFSASLSVIKTSLSLSGTNTGDQNLSGLVPYVGATTDVNLSTRSLSANNLTLGGTINPDGGSVKVGNGGIQFTFDNTSIYPDGVDTIIQPGTGNVKILTGLEIPALTVVSSATFTYNDTVASKNHRVALELGNSIRNPIIDDVSGSTRTLSASDYGKKLRCSNAAGCEITIPNDIGVSGDYFLIRRLSTAGPITLSLGGSVTVDGSAKVSDVTQGNEFAIMATGVNTYDFV